MKSEELFKLIDQIDRRFVEEAWEGDIDSGKAVEIILERRPIHAIKFAAAVAACILVFGAGIFTIANVRTNIMSQSGSAGESISADGSMSESSSESSSINESVHSSNVSGSNENVKIGKETLNYEFDRRGTITSCIVEKKDNLNYAVIYVDETDASEESPILAKIYNVTTDGDIDKSISEKVCITGRGIYEFHYTTLRGAGSRCVLCLEREDESPARILGTWEP